MKKGIYLLILFAALFTSCNSGNKVVSSFGKRKYTKGYYFNFAGHRKPAFSDGISTKVKKTNMHINSDIVNSRNFSTHSPGISANNKNLTVAHSFLSASDAEQKKVIIPVLPETVNNIASVKKILYNIFPAPTGVPGHKGANADTGSSNYDDVATIAFIFTMLAVVFIIIGLIFSSSIFVTGSGDWFAALIYIFAFIGLILGFIGRKSKKYRGFATAAEIIDLIIIIGTILLIILIIVLLAIFGL